MTDRRDFIKGMTAGAGLLTAASYRKVLGANERIRVGFIGIGLIGKRHLLDFMAQPDVEIAAICEVYEPRLEEGIATAAAASQSRPTRFKDFRQMYASKDIDAVVVSTPDHWHALQTIMACAAEKDVYVEKPLTHVVAEGQWMIDAVRHYKRVVQVGTQQRSGEHYQKCVDLIRNRHLGEIRNARIGSYRNIMPGFTKPVGDRPLSAADWEMWLGPAPFVPFEQQRCLYHFRWFWDYSGGQTTNLLAHDLDVVQWALQTTPQSVSAAGGRYTLKGIGETPDIFEAVFRYPGLIVNWSSNEVSANVRASSLEFCGTKGSLRLNRAGFEIVPDQELSPASQIPNFNSPPIQTTVAPPLRTEALRAEGYQQIRDQFRPHVRNFLDCVKSRQQPASDIESSVRTANSCHLANIAMKTGRTIQWDAKEQTIINDADAAKMLTKEYRAPWDRELKAALPR